MIKIKNYTNEELKYIQNNYNKQTIKQIALYLNKSEGSTYNAIRKLGLKKQVHQLWTDQENKYLQDNYMNLSSTELAQYLGRTYDAVNTQLDRLHLSRATAWTKEEILFLENNFDKMTHKQIGDKLNRTDSAIRAKCFELNLYKKELPWSDWEIEFLQRNYMEMTDAELSKNLNRTKDAIHLKASKLGMKKYPYTCDYHYFDVIDTEEKAYWLGFLTADGWISKNDQSNAGVTGIELQYGDIAHLKKFNKSIGGNYQITDRWRICNLSKSDKKNHSCLIRIFSLTMYDSLNKLGFSNDKSYEIEIPKILPSLRRHYIRGYFDGDGCLCYTSKSFSISAVTASEIFCNSLISLLKEEGFNCNIYTYINNFNTTMYCPSIYKYDEKIKFLDWIYSDCNIYLDRKYKKYLKVKETY